MNTRELLNQSGIETALDSLPEITGMSLRADTVQKGDTLYSIGKKYNIALFYHLI